MNDDQMKPRSLRFTWSMKTTSTRDPNEIMAEIREVSVEAMDFFQICVHSTEIVAMYCLLRFGFLNQFFLDPGHNIMFLFSYKIKLYHCLYGKP